MYTLVLLRHGESVWNKENRFTGWTDVDLSERGIEESHESGRVLKENGYSFDVAYTSVLLRGTRTTKIVLDEMGLADIPVKKSWRLNERHYGALQGLYKSETAHKFGEDKVHIWRRSFDVRPPALTKDDERWPGHDPVYGDVNPDDLPLTECLKDTIERVLPYWLDEIVPAIKSKKRVLISAHGNSLRALVKYLDEVSDEDIPNLNIPTGIPLVYELDDDMRSIRHFYLGDEEEVKKAILAVAAQGRAKKSE